LLGDTDRIQLAIGEKVSLILSNVFAAQTVGPGLVILRKFLDGAEVDADRNRRQIPTLEFLQQGFS